MINLSYVALDLDVGSVAYVTSKSSPSGAKGVEPLSLGALLLTLTAAGSAFTVVIKTLCDWLGRSTTARRISVTINGDTIVLEKSSTEERKALIEAYIRRHGAD